ncbi:MULTISPECIES: sulfotransferase [Okeania]|uniref:Sulfotransferase n=1 Tax=Okeania hirsuta TaxID=1458930 RepID=A0A3N6PUN4_9CYAN|nr:MULTISPECIES: sulfotransferase [Okeania]NET12865.1 sulfotransferase [Okeania sp. SIO1H6]NES75054.1 sulfotransferase [Okeania sp. SIO1H4]NES92678.1 sulfotransferase [Okeania sp. SIO2B9]NET19365.1 sulfotransferase [Okeania sp. SIO1H5]NET75624.1 sulfotransferase [Okeania sp. SIO1F9]
MVYRKLFVVGCPRSGTSWLKRMIGSHSDVLTVPNESHAYSITYNNFTYLKNQKFKKRLNSAKWILMSYGLKPLLFGFNSEDLWQGILNKYKIYQKCQENIGLYNLVSYAELEQLIAKVGSGSEDDLIKVRTLNQLMFDRFFENNGGSEKQILLEKKPQNLRYIDVILRQFPEAKSIEIIRDGRDVCVSYQGRAKTTRWAKQSTITVAKIWKKAIETREKAKADLEISDRIYSVRYENLRTESARRTEQNFLFYWFRLRSSFN